VAAVDVEVVGLKSLAADIARATSSPATPLGKALQDAGRAVATPIGEVARGAVPHDTGRLAAGIVVRPTRTGASIRSTVPYAGPVDFGGYPGDRPYIAGGRYMFPAAGDAAPHAETAYSAAVQRGLDSTPWSNAGTDPRGVHD
jgi:hypothetical protein